MRRRFSMPVLEGTGFFVSLLLLVAAAFVAVPVHAGPGQGFFAGPAVFYDSLGSDARGYARGSGLGVLCGYGFNRYWAAQASLFTTSHVRSDGGTSDLTGQTVDLKLTIPIRHSHIRPYLHGGSGRYELDAFGSVLRGNGGQYGAGIDIELFSSLYLTAGFARRHVDFEVPGGDVFATVTSMQYGFLWYFK